jgi:hypothetical protein
MYDYDYTNVADPTYPYQMSSAELGVWLVLTALVIAGEWKVFSKAKQPGWAVLVPIYNLYVTMKVVGRPWWWMLLLLIPLVNIVIAIVISNDLAKSFGKGVGYTLLILFFPFVAFPVLGFGDAKYVGPAAAK